MRSRIIVLYALAWISYITFSLAMFPYWHINTIIPSVGLVGLGGWIFGRTLGLAIILPVLGYHFLLLSFIYPHMLTYYESRAGGTFIYIIVAILVGTMRKNRDSMKEAHARLDRAVAERNAELARRAKLLLDRAEELRIQRGQALHDGIGQQLTGIQLYASSLAERLDEEQNIEAALAYKIKTRTRLAHNLIRGAARSLFPVQIEETGLLHALEEMTAYLRETTNTAVSIKNGERLQPIPHDLALNSYRICQETSLYLINNSAASRVTIEISESPTQIELMVKHDGQPVGERISQSVEAMLIDYRLSQIRGSMHIHSATDLSETIHYSINRTDVPPLNGTTRRVGQNSTAT